MPVLLRPKRSCLPMVRYLREPCNIPGAGSERKFKVVEYGGEAYLRFSVIFNVEGLSGQ